MTTTAEPTANVPAAGRHAAQHPQPAAARPSLVRLTAVELRKLADTRAGYWLLIVIALAAATIVTVQLFVMDDAAQTFQNFFTPSLIPVGVLLPVLGILSVTSEWSQRTALTTFALVPQRHRVAAAKVLAAIVAALASILASLAVSAIGTLVAAATGGDGSWSIEASMVAYAAVFQVINVLMGVAFGMLILNTPLAIVLYFVVPTVWGVLGELIKALREAAQWLDMGITTVPLTTADVTAGQWARISVSVLVWILVPLVAGLVRLTRREVS
jgi:ABC-type transport system involved in multi-copper enzyme maturation permease subunit